MDVQTRASILLRTQFVGQSQVVRFPPGRVTGQAPGGPDLPDRTCLSHCIRPRDCQTRNRLIHSIQWFVMPDT